jgi:uncharacterized membrane protein
MCAVSSACLSPLFSRRRPSIGWDQPGPLRWSARIWQRSRFLKKALPAAAALVLISGLSMVLLTWGWMQAWIDSALAVLVLLAVAGPIVTGRRVTRIRRASATGEQAGEDLPDAIVPLLGDPVLLGYAAIPLVMGLAIVALMVFKPDWIACAELLVGALVIGLGVGQVAVRRRRRSPQHADGPGTRVAQA